MISGIIFDASAFCRGSPFIIDMKPASCASRVLPRFEIRLQISGIASKEITALSQSRRLELGSGGI